MSAPATVYRPRNPQDSDYYRCVEDNFETFVQIYDEYFSRQYGFWRPYIEQVIYRYLDCGNLHNGFARVKCSGYPRNLKGEEICMEARILTVADVVEAMALHRPYRPGLGIDAALNEIEKNRGIFYDDAVVDTCLRIFREKKYRLAEG